VIRGAALVYEHFGVAAPAILHITGRARTCITMRRLVIRVIKKTRFNNSKFASPHSFFSIIPYNNDEKILLILTILLVSCSHHNRPLSDNNIDDSAKS
jgi:hypothetical protein